MCGIFGKIESKNHLYTDKLDYSEVLTCLKHRGPDQSDVFTENSDSASIILGHTRLAIIDITDSGRQPISTADGRFTITYNGEIYNYKELKDELFQKGIFVTTNTDTEVLLQCWATWGESCLEKLIGMFSFAIYDKQQKRLFCARDAFGIKPFYFTSVNGFAFASEIPSLIKLTKCSPNPNFQKAYDYLVHGICDDDDHTFFEGIYKLPAGSYIIVDVNHSRIIEKKKWTDIKIHEQPCVDYADAVKNVRRIFLNNIKLHLRSDVPIGAALSGGLDSSSVVCAMRYLEPSAEIHTFTYVAKDASIDEEIWADKINKYVGAIPHKVQVSSEDLALDIDNLIYAQGEPFSTTSIYAQYKVFEAAARNGIKVTLDGQGADELLAGYNGYPLAVVCSLFERNEILKSIKFLVSWAKWPNRGYVSAIKIFLLNLLPNKFKIYARKFFLENDNPTWINNEQLIKYGIKKYLKSHPPNPDAKGRRVAEALRDTLTHGAGLESLLRYADRNSMRWSVESRVPFLTLELAQYLLSLPESYLISISGRTKSIFRDAMDGIVPQETLTRKDKIGFNTPEYEWLHGQSDNIKGWLGALKDIPILNEQESRSMIQDMLDKKAKFSGRAWRIINYCCWWQMFIENYNNEANQVAGQKNLKGVL